MLHLQDAHNHANDGIPHHNGSYVDGKQAAPTATTLIAAPKPGPAGTGDATTGPGISETSVLLTWLLFLSRNNNEDQDLSPFTWGYVSRDGTETALPLPEQYETPSQPYFAPHQTISTATVLLNEALGRNDNGKSSELGNGQTLFFCDATAPVSEKQQLDGTTPEPEWSFRLELASLDEQLCFQAQWRESILTRELVEQHLGTFIDLLRLVVEHPGALVRKALGPLERDLEQIWAWNAILPQKIDKCTHEIISDYATQNPDAMAVSAWDGEFTYGQVDALSTRLARNLVSLGIELGTAVPLCFEKSRWTVVAVLAVMKAGGTFVLTDPSQPQARLQTIVEQTHAKIIVSSALQQDLAGRIALGGHVLVVSNELLEEIADERPVTITLPTVPADTPMYIIFTSGSTGKPKGVVISHANYTSGALPRAEAVGYKKDLRVFEFASYAFDVSIDCMLCTLATGGCICVPADEERMNDLSGAIRRANAKMAHMTPSVARVLDPDILPSLDVLGLGGEAISAGDAVAWNEHTSVIIAYGPSECTVGCTINNNVGANEAYTNIGKGVGGLTWITDPADHNNLVPVGAVGELLIEGPVVGVGYLDEPEKSAEVFIEDPEWLLAGSKGVPGRNGRLYKTGDLVKYDPDGSGAIVFVGRKDQQVKIRGQRVELVEIEHHLHGKVPGGARMVVEVIKPGGGDPTLVVFLEEERQGVDGPLSEADVVTLSPELCLALPDIESALETELPRYMIPTAYIPLSRIPSLVSGKTDRKKLRELGASMTRQQVASFRVVADISRPETEEELALHDIWKRILGTTGDVSLSDSFFALGGDSLKAMKLVASARAEGIRLTVSDIFVHPTLRDMAVMVKKISSDPAETGVIAPFSLLTDGWVPDEAKVEVAKLCCVEESAVEDAYPCTPLQEALMALSAKIKEAYVAQRVLDLPDLPTAQRLQAAFETAADDCAILRTRITQVPGRGLVQVVLKEKIPWRTAASLQEYLDRDRNEEMELGKPLVRYGLVSDADTSKFHFVFTIHHSLYDGWSMPLVIDRVNRAFQGLPTHRPARFGDFIRFLNKQDRAACEAFWRNNLAGATGPQFPPLPWEGYQARADELLELFVPLAGRPASNTTVATVIRGAWALVAANYTACDDVVFGETLTGRNAPIEGVEEIEGPMITTVPVRVRVDRKASVAEYLRAIHDQAVAQIPYEHTGLQHIRRLSDDALQACELRTGLVLHPGEDGEEPPSAREDQPANGLAPAGDAEAAQEALKFNTYSIMLVCSLSSNGFLIMASFDSKTVDKQTMETVLNQLSLVSRQLCEETDKCINDVEYLTGADMEEIWRVGSSPNAEALGDGYKDITAAWIVDPADPVRLLPRGAVGELVVEVQQDDLDLPILKTPAWLAAQSADGPAARRLARTELLAKFNPDGSLVKVGRKDALLAKAAAIVPRARPTAVTAASNKQKSLRNLWGRVLRMDQNNIGLGDNFFRLGGDSITAMKLVSEVRLVGFELTVAQVFANRSLFDMANVLQEASGTQARDAAAVTAIPYSSLDIPNVEEFVEQSIRPRLANQAWKVTDVLPVRPLQEIAIKGTVQLPRYSMRYEMLHFDCPIDAPRLLGACQEVVAMNEILHTVFVEVDGTYFGVVLDQLVAPVAEFDVQDGDVETFARKVCEVDVQQRTTLGSSFVSFSLVHGHDAKSTLVFRISHAQYDEICLPIFLHQLSAIYESRPQIPQSVPFSAFVGHVQAENIPQSIPYWRDLLRGSTLTTLRPDVTEFPVTSTRHYAIQHKVNIAARSRDITVATLPTAAWALTLSRRRGGLRDVTFGEVVSGRNAELPGCEMVAGPCWQYVPVRVRLPPGYTGMELLEAVEHQHIASSRFEGMGLQEIVRECETGWDAQDAEWFDSVVHQDVEHVEDLPFMQARCRMETLYLHEEPLREWKVQAFPDGDELTLEIVTVESWAGYAEGLLKDLADALEVLVQRPREVIVGE